MAITVYNVSSTAALVRWQASGGCRDTFYSVMYDPRWSSVEVGYQRKRFRHEERIPASRSGAHVANLLPNTAYFLCVTCQAANPVKDQCQVFSTLGVDAQGAGGGGGGGGGGWEMAMGVWMASSLILLLVSALLLWGCLHNACPLARRRHAHGHANGHAPADVRVDAPEFLYGGGGGACDDDVMSGKRTRVILNPMFGALGVRGPLGVTGGRGAPPLHQQEIRRFTKLSGCEPV